MSRTIKISSMDQVEDYINRQNNQLRSLENQMANTANESRVAAQREAEMRVNALRHEIEKLEDGINSQITGMGNEMTRMDIAHRQALKRQSENFYQNLSQLKDWTENTITNLEHAIEESFQDQQGQIDEQRERTNVLYAREEDAQHMSREMLNDVVLLVSAVGSRINHAKFAGDRWSQLVKRVERLLKESLPPAAVIAEAFNISNHLWEFEEDVLKAQLKFDAIHSHVLKEASELLGLMNKNRNELVFTDDKGANKKDKNGNDIIVELDYWTHGEYSEIEKRALGVKRDLEANKDSPELTEERLNEINEKIQNLRLQQSDLIVLAVKRGIASQERKKISHDIVKALKEQGFDMKKTIDNSNAYNYLGSDSGASDFREGVFALLKNGAGMEITIIVHPNEDLTKNHILFQRNDNTLLTDDELRKSINGIRKVIAGKGYTLGGEGAPTGTGDEKQAELADANALAKSGISKDLKSRLGFNTQQRK